jgi:hypothetical protein
MQGWRDIERAAELQGLRLRGGFAVAPDDAVPPLAGGRAAVTLVLLGAIGGSLWPAFSRSPELADGLPDPLDRWSRRVVGALAEHCGAAALFPFGGPPYLPFQRWAARAEPVAPSPLGLFIHPRYGLWHSYRGALAFAETLQVPPREELASPCESCAAKPCLSTCPVGAFSPGGYDVQGCVAHLQLAVGERCMQSACQARRACPVAPDLGYEEAQARFHMAAFLTARRRRERE